MKLQQYYLSCLSQASYLVGDETTGRAVVVDPRRDVAEYLADATADGFTIVAVIETHFHADFVSGHLELAAATGAEIIFGAAAQPDYPHRSVVDGERMSLGEVVLEFRATPGHTPESISVVVWEHAEDPEPYGVLTGDTLFIGDVGRPDLLASVGVTADELGHRLYESLHTKLLTLPDSTRVFPAHGAGSACGKSLSTETVSTIGAQRRENYALAPMTAEEFVAVVTEGQRDAPGYFSHDVGANKSDHELLSEDPPPELSIDEVIEHLDSDDHLTVLDTRDPAEFARGHLRGSVNVGLDGRFAEYVGTVVAPDDHIIVITASGTAAEARIRLGRIGFDDVVGAVSDPDAALSARPDRVDTASRVTASALRQRLAEHDDITVIDVRAASEHAAGTVPGAVHIELGHLGDAAASGQIDLERPIVVHCAGGYRSSIGASVLRRAGGVDVSDLVGGHTAWRMLDGDAATGAVS